MNLKIGQLWMKLLNKLQMKRNHSDHYSHQIQRYISRIKMKFLPAVTLLASAAAHSQTPEVDAWKAAKQAEVAAVIAAQTASTINQLAIKSGVEQLLTRITALESKVDSALATLKELQTRPGITTQQVIDALVLKLSAP
jgi:hypothetical protein